MSDGQDSPRTCPETFDLDLGDGHWVRWSDYGTEEHVGGIIYHTKADNPSGLCSGCFWISDKHNRENGTTHALWTMTGSFEEPTLAPSFLCHCGDHGFIRNGKWERA